MAGSHGSLPNLVNELEALQQLEEEYIDALVSETKMTKEEIKNMLERKVNVYLSAEEAVKLGIADIII
jgi:ATP-dependent protease ClpP protease subunit